jgi:hypothetical protein
MPVNTSDPVIADFTARHVQATLMSDDPRLLDVFITGDDAGAQGTRVVDPQDSLAATARHRRLEGRSPAPRSELAVGASGVRRGCHPAAARPSISAFAAERGLEPLSL